jgi:hypothetical protein
MARHLAVISSLDLVDRVLSGQKTIEARLTANRAVPFGIISHGDEILFKNSGGLVYGQAIVSNVLFYEDLTGEMIGKLRKEYGQEMEVDDSYWQQHSNARYASIIFLSKPKRYLSPLKIDKKDRRPWVVLD